MEDALFKTLASLGGTGVLAFVLWQIAKRFMEAHADQVKVTHAEMSKRVDALEIASAACEADRRRLNEHLIEILSTKHQSHESH